MPQNTGTVAGEGDSNLIPDLVVARFVAGTKVLDRGTYDLAVEVISRSSRSYERFVKPRLYGQTFSHHTRRRPSGSRKVTPRSSQ